MLNSGEDTEMISTWLRLSKLNKHKSSITEKINAILDVEEMVSRGEIGQKALENLLDQIENHRQLVRNLTT